MKHDFIIEQLKKIHDLIEWIHTCKRTGTHIIEEFKMFKDIQGNFYASYALHGAVSGNMSSSIEYIQIDREGTKIDLNKSYSSAVPLHNKFEKLEPITF